MATELGGLVFEITRDLIGDLFRAKMRALQEATQPTPPKRFTTSEGAVVANINTKAGFSFRLKLRPMPIRRRRRAS
jgi:hypothetical protein